MFWIGAVNFEYGNFENGNFDTNLSSKNRRFVCLKTSDGNFEFSIKNGNFENVVRDFNMFIRHITETRNWSVMTKV